MQLTTKNSESAWNTITVHIMKQGRFLSVRGVKYTASYTNNVISFVGVNRSDGESETISKDEFIKAFDLISDMVKINTNTIKKIIPTNLYRKRSPFYGLLLSSGVLQK